jgi:hypothetical protein
MALGELQLMPDEFWRLTNGELMAKIRGFVVLRDLASANHRNLYTLMANLHREERTAAKKPSELWPLDIDSQGMSMDEKQELYSKVANNGV